MRKTKIPSGPGSLDQIVTYARSSLGGHRPLQESDPRLLPQVTLRGPGGDQHSSAPRQAALGPPAKSN